MEHSKPLSAWNDLVIYSVEPSEKSPVKNIKTSTWGAHFTILPASPCVAEFYEIWHTRSARRRSHVCQNFSQLVQGLRSSDTQNCRFPLTCCVALTAVYALPCDTVIHTIHTYTYIHRAGVQALVTTAGGLLYCTGLVDSSGRVLAAQVTKYSGWTFVPMSTWTAWWRHWTVSLLWMCM